MLTWQQDPDKFAVIHVEDGPVHGSRTPDMRLQEAVGLVEALGEEVVLSQTINLTKQTPKTYLGGGQVERLAEDVVAHELTVVLVNANLSPTQQRNLELACQCKVVDRTGIILAIFASRARPPKTWHRCCCL